MGSDQGGFLLGRHIQKAREYVRKHSPLSPHTVQSIGNFSWNPCRFGAPCSLPTDPLLVVIPS